MAILKITKTCHGNVPGGHLHEYEIEISRAGSERGGTSFSVPDLSGITGMRGPIWGKGDVNQRSIPVAPEKNNLRQ